LQAAPGTAWQPSPPDHLVVRRGRQRLTATVAAAVFVLSGLALIGVAIATQRRAPAAPALTVSGVDLPASRPPVTPMPLPGSAADRPTSRRAPNHVTEAAATVATGQAALPLDRVKPASISIPAIGVRSVVRHLGQAPNGSLEVPSGAQYNDAAWYRHSPTPGSLGPAVMLGHVDSAAQGPSVFFRLGELRRGHRVTITRADGSVAVFVVDAVHRYPKKDFPTELVYNDLDHAGLRLVTCGGAFDDAAGSYMDNVVVFASLVE
jgi:hypothetical protein